MNRCLHLFVSILLLLSMTPCLDDFGYDQCLDEEHVHWESDQGEGHEGEDDCSPFCSCACCKVPVTSSILVPLELDNPILPGFTQRELKAPVPPYFDIWQPPKI